MVMVMMVGCASGHNKRDGFGLTNQAGRFIACAEFG